jgi:hypothetical protein
MFTKKFKKSKNSVCLSDTNQNRFVRHTDIQSFRGQALKDQECLQFEKNHHKVHLEEYLEIDVQMKVIDLEILILFVQLNLPTQFPIFNYTI